MLHLPAFPWHSLPNDTTVCDVGGGNGHATLGLAKSFPHLRIVVQDLGHVVANGKPVSFLPTYAPICD